MRLLPVPGYIGLRDKKEIAKQEYPCDYRRDTFSVAAWKSLLEYIIFYRYYDIMDLM